MVQRSQGRLNRLGLKQVLSVCCPQQAQHLLTVPLPNAKTR